MGGMDIGEARRTEILKCSKGVIIGLYSYFN